jgi:hypothetical protein
MKRSMRTIFVLLAIVLSFVAVQAAWAKTCDVTVEGNVTAIDYDNNAITINSTIVYGMRLPYLANKLNIELQEGDYVVITAHLCPSTDRLSACTVSVVESLTTTAADGTCDCCPGCTSECDGDCYPDCTCVPIGDEHKWKGGK